MPLSVISFADDLAINNRSYQLLSTRRLEPEPGYMIVGKEGNHYLLGLIVNLNEKIAAWIKVAFGQGYRSCWCWSPHVNLISRKAHVHILLIRNVKGRVAPPAGGMYNSYAPSSVSPPPFFYEI